MIIREVLHKLRNTNNRAVLAGALRRRSTSKRGVPVIVTTAFPFEVDRLFCIERLPESDGFMHFTGQTFIDGMQIYIVSARKEYLGATLLWYTGPEDFRQCMCTEARAQGFVLNRFGLWKGKYRHAGVSERQIFSYLGLDYIKPKDRRRFMTELRQKLPQNKMARDRREVYLAIEAILARRKRGNLPAVRTEILAETGLPGSHVSVCLKWLMRNDFSYLDSNEGGRGGWRNNSLPEQGVCWIHGLQRPCRTCRRKDKEK